MGVHSCEQANGAVHTGVKRETARVRRRGSGRTSCGPFARRGSRRGEARGRRRRRRISEPRCLMKRGQGADRVAGKASLRCHLRKVREVRGDKGHERGKAFLAEGPASAQAQRAPRLSDSTLTAAVKGSHQRVLARAIVGPLTRCHVTPDSPPHCAAPHCQCFAVTGNCGCSRSRTPQSRHPLADPTERREMENQARG